MQAECSLSNFYANSFEGLSLSDSIFSYDHLCSAIANLVVDNLEPFASSVYYLLSLKIFSFIRICDSGKQWGETSIDDHYCLIVG